EVRTLATLVDEPPRHSGMPRPEAGAPVRGAQGCHVDAPRRDREHEVAYQTRLLERGPDRDDASHRLREQRHAAGDVANDTRDEIVDSSDTRVGGHATESGPGDEPAGAGMAELLAHRLPELNVAGRARQEHQRLGHRVPS